MKKVNKDKVIKIVLYIMSLLLLLYFLYAAYVAFDYIAQVVASGEIELGSSVGKVIQYVMTNTFSYLFYSIVFACMAYGVGYMQANKKQEESIVDMNN